MLSSSLSSSPMRVMWLRPAATSSCRQLRGVVVMASGNSNNNENVMSVMRQQQQQQRPFSMLSSITSTVGMQKHPSITAVLTTTKSANATPAVTTTTIMNNTRIGSVRFMGISRKKTTKRTKAVFTPIVPLATSNDIVTPAATTTGATGGGNGGSSSWNNKNSPIRLFIRNWWKRGLLVTTMVVGIGGGVYFYAYEHFDSMKRQLYNNFIDRQEYLYQRGLEHCRNGEEREELESRHQFWFLLAPVIKEYMFDHRRALNRNEFPNKVRQLMVSVFGEDEDDWPKDIKKMTQHPFRELDFIDFRTADNDGEYEDVHDSNYDDDDHHDHHDPDNDGAENKPVEEELAERYTRQADELFQKIREQGTFPGSKRDR